MLKYIDVFFLSRLNGGMISYMTMIIMYIYIDKWINDSIDGKSAAFVDCQFLAIKLIRHT